MTILDVKYPHKNKNLQMCTIEQLKCTLASAFKNTGTLLAPLVGNNKRPKQSLNSIIKK
jgi:hypothetical protein